MYVFGGDGPDAGDVGKPGGQFVGQAELGRLEPLAMLTAASW